MLQPGFTYKLYVGNRTLHVTVSLTTPLGLPLPSKLERYVVMFLFYLSGQIAKNVLSKQRHVAQETLGEMLRVATGIALLKMC